MQASNVYKPIDTGRQKCLFIAIDDFWAGEIDISDHPADVALTSAPQLDVLSPSACSPFFVLSLSLQDTMPEADQDKVLTGRNICFNQVFADTSLTSIS